MSEPSSSDTLGDVGVGLKVENQLQRTTLADGFTAAAKRLTEALRALAETVQVENGAIAAEVERLRYEAYTFEKDVVLFARPVEAFTTIIDEELRRAVLAGELQPVLAERDDDVFGIDGVVVDG